MNPKLMYPVRFPICFMIWKQIIQFWITASYTRYEIVTVTRKIVGNDALKSKPFAITVGAVTGFSPFKKENNKKNRKKHTLVEDDDIGDDYDDVELELLDDLTFSSCLCDLVRLTAGRNEWAVERWARCLGDPSHDVPPIVPALSRTWCTLPALERRTKNVDDDRSTTTFTKKRNVVKVKEEMHDFHLYSHKKIVPYDSTARPSSAISSSTRWHETFLKLCASDLKTSDEALRMMNKIELSFDRNWDHLQIMST